MEYYFLGRSSGKSGKGRPVFSDGMFHMEIRVSFLQSHF